MIPRSMLRPFIHLLCGCRIVSLNFVLVHAHASDVRCDSEEGRGAKAVGWVCRQHVLSAGLRAGGSIFFCQPTLLPCDRFCCKIGGHCGVIIIMRRQRWFILPRCGLSSFPSGLVFSLSVCLSVCLSLSLSLSLSPCHQAQLGLCAACSAAAVSACLVFTVPDVCLLLHGSSGSSR